jgi:type I restriction enzyme R subunit
MADIDAEVDELAEDEEESAQSQLKSRWAALEKVVGAQPRVVSVAADLVAHFEERNKAQTGKAMVVAMSREICVHLYDEIIKLRPDWHNIGENDYLDFFRRRVFVVGFASDVHV